MLPPLMGKAVEVVPQDLTAPVVRLGSYGVRAKRLIEPAQRFLEPARRGALECLIHAVPVPFWIDHPVLPPPIER